MAAPADATLLEVLVRVPAAAEVILARGGALSLEDRKALRLVHPELREAVSAEIRELKAKQEDGAPAPPPPTARLWPALRELTLVVAPPGLEAALRALGAATWSSLGELTLKQTDGYFVAAFDVGVPAARALAAAALSMPALATLHLGDPFLGEGAIKEVFARAGLWPRLAYLDVGQYCDVVGMSDYDGPRHSLQWEAAPGPGRRRRGAAKASSAESLRLLAATRLRVDELWISAAGEDGELGGFAAAPAFTLRTLKLTRCRLDAAGLCDLAAADWPLEELTLEHCNLDRTDSPALVALARHAGLRRLCLVETSLGVHKFRALVAAPWPALRFISANLLDDGNCDDGNYDDDGNSLCALDGASFAAMPRLEELRLTSLPVGAEGAALLARRRWPRLTTLILGNVDLDAAALAALARGAWPALKFLYLPHGEFDSRLLTLAAARAWAPALEFVWTRASVDDGRW